MTQLAAYARNRSPCRGCPLSLGNRCPVALTSHVFEVSTRFQISRRSGQRSYSLIEVLGHSLLTLLLSLPSLGQLYSVQ